MSFGLSIKNNSNEFLISSEMRNLHHFATYTNPSISVPNVNYGGLTRFTYTFTLNSNYVPVPFFTTPFTDRYYAIEKISNSGNTWTVQLISSSGFPTTTDTGSNPSGSQITTDLSSTQFNGTANTSGSTGNYFVELLHVGQSSLQQGTNFNGSVDPITNNIVRYEQNGVTKLGTGMSYSGGIFTFPSTGFWRIIVHFQSIRNPAGHQCKYMQIRTNATTNNSSYEHIAIAENSYYDNYNAGSRHGGGHSEVIFDCQNTSTHKLKFS